MLRATADGSVELYYDAAKKLETTATGIQVTDEVSIGTSLVHTGDTDTKVSFGTDEIVLTTAGTDAVKVDSAGNVGIGTASPSEVLGVLGNIKLENGAQRNIIGPTNENLGIFANPNDTTEGILFSTDNGTTTEMIILNGGNVGIGIAAPLFKLHTYRDDATATPSVTIEQDGTGDASIHFLLSGIVGWSAGLDNSDGDKFKIHNSQGFAGSFFTIDGTGDVGIGTAAPSYPLEISNNTSTSIAYQRTGVSAKKWGFHSDNDATYWQNITDGSFNLTIQNGGNIGIGTTAPVNKQQNKYTGVAIASMTATAGTASTNWNRSAGLLIEESNSSNGLALGVSETANDRKSWIQSGHPGAAANVLGTLSLNPLGGNVGIGTITPTAALQVVGLAEHADNAAALLAGLTAGAFYRTGDLLKVVH